MRRKLVILAILVGIAWFAAKVPLGERTLLEHIRYMTYARDSEELKERADGLLQGTKQAAQPTVDKVSNQLTPPVDPNGDARKWQKSSVQRFVK